MHTHLPAQMPSSTTLFRHTLLICLLLCREGDAVMPGVPPGPLVLVLSSAPHTVFSRRGASDLKAKVKLPLLSALTGGCVRLDTLDGR